MERAKILEKMIDEAWTSKRQFAESVGLPPTTLQSILKRGVGNASVDNVIKVCKGLGITVEQLERKAAQYAVTNTSDSIVLELPSIYRVLSDTSRYPFFPVAISAGLPSSVDSLTENDVKQIEVPDSIMGKWAGSDDIYLMRVNGDSMNKVFPNGSIIAVKKVNLDALCNDDIVVFSNENEYSVKRYFNDVESRQLIFSSESTDRRFTDRTIPYSEAENLIIHGKVVVYIVELS